MACPWAWKKLGLPYWKQNEGELGAAPWTVTSDSSGDTAGTRSRKAEDAVSVSTLGSQDHRYPQLPLSADSNQHLAKLFSSQRTESAQVYVPPSSQISAEVLRLMSGTFSGRQGAAPLSSPRPCFLFPASPRSYFPGEEPGDGVRWTDVPIQPPYLFARWQTTELLKATVSSAIKEKDHTSLPWRVVWGLRKCT